MAAVIETLQTTAPLTELRLEHAAYTLGWFKLLAEKDDASDLDLDQPYQRGHVWSDYRRRLLIRSLMQGIPIGVITVNDRFSAGFHESAYGPRRVANRNWAYAIVDGKQRFTTFVMWMHSKLSVPASWFPAEDVMTTEETEDGPYVRLSSLVKKQTRFFRNIPVSVVLAKVKTLAEEQAVFDLINFGGVAQGEVDV